VDSIVSFLLTLLAWALCLGVLGGLAAWAWKLHNALLEITNDAREKVRGIAAKMIRYQTIKQNVIEIAKQYAAHEFDTLSAVSRKPAARPEGGGNAGLGAATAGLGLGGLLAVVESQYPTLKANRNFLALQMEAQEINTEIESARKTFAEVEERYRNLRGRFPNVLIAGLIGFPEELGRHRNLLSVGFRPDLLAQDFVPERQI
jgi:LemA protein